MILCDIIYFSKIENRVIKVRKYIDKEVVAVSKEYEMKWKEKAVTKERGSVKGNVLISGIIICRNEEENISKVLDSLIDLKIDEIVVIDTGSEDGTLKIIETYIYQNSNIRMYRYQWKDSFSEARNFGIRKAKNDWLFFVDADERVTNTNDRSIQSMITYYSEMCGDEIAFCPVIVSSKFNKLYGNPRIFNKKSGYRYYGNVHEMLRKSEDEYNTIPFVCLNIIIEHEGYGKRLIKSKLQRNLRLLDFCIEKERENPIWYCYKLRDGRDFLDFDEKKQLYENVQKIYKENVNKSFYQYCFDWAASVFIQNVVKMGDIKLAKNLLIEVLTYGKCSVEDQFYLKTLVKLLEIETDLLNLETECTVMQENADFSSSIIDTAGYYIDELKMRIFEKEHKMGDYFKMKEFLYSVGYICDMETI